MNPGGEVADQVVNMTLKTLEIVAKLSGSGAKNLATYLYAVLSSKKKTHGKTRLQSMLKSGRSLKVFTVRSQDLELFTKEAKKYGILYCALKDKNNTDNLCDIMIPVEDAPKVQRITERFQLSVVDTASIKTEVQREQAKQEMTPENSNVIFEDLLVGGKDTDPQQPTEEMPPSKTILPSSRTTTISTNEKPSVRAELFDIKQTVAKEKEQTKDMVLSKKHKEAKVVKHAIHKKSKNRKAR
jgi:hypothetical protein